MGNTVKPQFTPTGCLLNALRRDMERGYKEHEAGWRSTREVQEFVGEPLDKVRRQLTNLSLLGVVSALKDKEMGVGLFWAFNEPLKPGDRVKVIRPISARDEIVIATVEAIEPSCVLPIQVKFDDGQQSGYLHQEIREIVL